MIRTTLATISALLVLALPARAADDFIATPTLRASITVTSDVVRVGDLIDNAGSAALIPVYRSPDLGTTGALPVAHVLSVLRAKQVIGVMTGDIKEVQVTRLARTFASKDLENAVASALERRFGFSEVHEKLARSEERIELSALAIVAEEGQRLFEASELALRGTMRLRALCRREVGDACQVERSRLLALLGEEL